MKFGDKLKSFRIAQGLTQEDLARRLGMKKQNISRYENSEREPNIRTAKAIADALGVTLQELTLGASSFAPDNILPFPRMAAVPLIGTIACGDPILAQENIEGEVSAPEHVVADFALRCKGDSMINARIYDGDIVYIRQQARVDNGQIAAVLIGDEATLKRVYFYPETNKLVLNPENPAYEPLIFVGDELATVRILGRAVAFTSNVR